MAKMALTTSRMKTELMMGKTDARRELKMILRDLNCRKSRRALKTRSSRKTVRIGTPETMNEDIDMTTTKKSNQFQPSSKNVFDTLDEKFQTNSKAKREVKNMSNRSKVTFWAELSAGRISASSMLIKKFMPISSAKTDWKSRLWYALRLRSLNILSLPALAMCSLARRCLINFVIS